MDILSQEAGLGETCFKSEGQPSICNYGDYCQISTSRCTGVPYPTCSNFELHGRNWDANTSTGPVIYDARAIRFAPDTIFCTSYAPTRVTFRLKAYAPSADLPTALEGFSQRFYFVAPSGIEFNASALQNITTTSDRKHITFDINLCLPSRTTSYTAGFFFVGGSEICVTAS
ncbi:hypothetical protein [Corallococcus carmarthensis]|uniref:hypothetical protein n=1 Tax=Corallococcus carmarthensis TaxID=2316728 RepID=UPI0011C4145C|nr:hypothetical protein [Corallococcus carmarthensis]